MGAARHRAAASREANKKQLHKATGEPGTARTLSRWLRLVRNSEAEGLWRFVYEPTEKNIKQCFSYTFNQARASYRFGKIGMNALATSSRPNKKKQGKLVKMEVRKRLRNSRNLIPSKN